MLLLMAQYLKVQLSAFLSELVSFSSFDVQCHEFAVVATVMQDLVCQALQHLSVQQQLLSWGSLRKTSQRYYFLQSNYFLWLAVHFMSNGDISSGCRRSERPVYNTSIRPMECGYPLLIFCFSVKNQQFFLHTEIDGGCCISWCIVAGIDLIANQMNVHSIYLFMYV